MPHHAALLLDLDGTLLDFAPTPDAVIVPAGLIADLRAVRQRLGDALAIVTGRPIAQVDGLLGDAPFAVAGEHGTALRPAPGAAIQHIPLPAMPADWADRAMAAAARHDGALYEPKAHGFVLHYRKAPQAGQNLHAAALDILGQHPDFMVLSASMAWEVKPVAADKGSALRALMSRAPFAGRTPIYVGDDVTDLDAIHAAQEMGGVGWQVGPVFVTPGGVRTWLHDLARTI
ncbi:MAG: trehalose-phosphatase [Acetobacteraceae bacterium]|nr:trehalose-phosphatase [Acetobacteraceae bacterium]